MVDTRGTRERLLEATIEMIGQLGEVGVKVDVIANAANITKPSLYHFFGDREGLIVAAQAERFRRSVRFGLPELLEQARSCTDQEQFAELIRGTMRGFSNPAGRDRRRVRLEVFGSSVSRPALKEQVNAIILETADELAVLFDIGRERGWLKTPLSSRSIAMWWYGSLLGRYIVESNDQLSTDEWDDIMVKTGLHLLFGDD